MPDIGAIMDAAPQAKLLYKLLMLLRCDDWSIAGHKSRPRKSEHGLMWNGCSDGRG